MTSTIGSRIKKMRKAAGLKLAALSAITHIDQSQLSKMENDKFDLPSVERIRRIAAALNTTPNDIIIGGRHK
jgi:transcriptional regulator with XRE-family HTH domain